jgi:hypothetical protein
LPANDAYDDFGIPAISIDRTANNIDSIELNADEVKTENGTFRFVEETWDFNIATTTLFLNVQDFYSKFITKRTFTCSAIQLYCFTLGVDPTNLDAKIYPNAGGAAIASMSSTVLVSAAGIVTLEFDTPITLNADTGYWVGVSGDASDSKFLATTFAHADISWNRFDSNATCQASLPTGTNTATRFCVRLVE